MTLRTALGPDLTPSLTLDLALYFGHWKDRSYALGRLHSQAYFGLGTLEFGHFA